MKYEKKCIIKHTKYWSSSVVSLVTVSQTRQTEEKSFHKQQQAKKNNLDVARSLPPSEQCNDSHSLENEEMMKNVTKLNLRQN